MKLLAEDQIYQLKCNGMVLMKVVDSVEEVAALVIIMDLPGRLRRHPVQLQEAILIPEPVPV